MKSLVIAVTGSFLVLIGCLYKQPDSVVEYGGSLLYEMALTNQQSIGANTVVDIVCVETIFCL